MFTFVNPLIQFIPMLFKKSIVQYFLFTISNFIQKSSGPDQHIFVIYKQKKSFLVTDQKLT
jgi:hypothetical protein